MKLYTFDIAPNPRRVALFCEYKHIELEKVTIDITKGEHLTPAFKMKNPLARLPVLELDTGEIITESLAICQYLERCFPEKTLFGKDELQQAHIWMWSLRLSELLEAPSEHAFRHLHPSMVKRVEQNAAWGEHNREEILQGIDFLDRHLESAPYVCGENLSMADIVAYCAIGFAKVSKVVVDEKCVYVSDWQQRMDAIFNKS
jgi:glutathione S-transferase